MKIIISFKLLSVSTKVSPRKVDGFVRRSFVILGDNKEGVSFVKCLPTVVPAIF